MPYPLQIYSGRSLKLHLCLIRLQYLVIMASSREFRCRNFDTRVLSINDIYRQSFTQRDGTFHDVNAAKAEFHEEEICKQNNLHNY